MAAPCFLLTAVVLALAGTLLAEPPKLPQNQPTKAQITLGEDLFFDGRLSIDGSVSCAACHDPTLAFSDDRPRSRGFNGRFSRRHSMPLFNLASKPAFFWDGRAGTLREQVLEPIQDHREMAARLPSVLYRLNRNQDYRRRFRKHFGADPIRVDDLAQALAIYCASLTSFDSKWDRVQEKKATFTSLEEKGRRLFFTEPAAPTPGAGCFRCHNAPLFTDHKFRFNGVMEKGDLGRFEVTGQESDRFKVMTPSLRNLRLTAPYMHNGSLPDLNAVLDHYAKEQKPHPNLAPELRVPLILSTSDREALKAFFLTLTGKEMAFE